MTEWHEYLEMDWPALASSLRSPLLLDGRHALDKTVLERAGFRYLSLT